MRNMDGNGYGNDHSGDGDDGQNSDSLGKGLSNNGLSGEIGGLSTTWRLRLSEQPSTSETSSSLYAARTAFDLPERPEAPDQPSPGESLPRLTPSEEHDSPGRPSFGPVRSDIPGALFGKRYHTNPPNASRATDGEAQPMRPFSQERPSGGPPVDEGGAMRQRYADEYFSSALYQRRLVDERATGRRWPTTGLAIPGATPANTNEARYFYQMGIALGEVDPAVLARESALRYVYASRLRGEGDLGPTDIYSIAYFGLGLTIRPLDCTGLPHVLAVYHRATREIYLDWTLLRDAPQGRAVLDSAVWRRAVDASQLVRFLLAWCSALHLIENYDAPLVLGFTPAPHAPSGGMSGGPAPVAINSDTLNRYRKAAIATATLLAPAERVWQQAVALNRNVRIGDPDWRTQVRASYRSYGAGPDAGWPGTPAPGRFGGIAAAAPFGGYNAGGGGEDPVLNLLGALAEGNNCPPLLVEQQLDGSTTRLEWGAWSARLMREVPELRMRYAPASKLFSGSAANPAGGWGGRPMQGSQLVHAQLSL